MFNEVMGMGEGLAAKKPAEDFPKSSHFHGGPPFNGLGFPRKAERTAKDNSLQWQRGRHLTWNAMVISGCRTFYVAFQSFNPKKRGKAAYPGCSNLWVFSLRVPFPKTTPKDQTHNRTRQARKTSSWFSKRSPWSGLGRGGRCWFRVGPQNDELLDFKIMKSRLLYRTSTPAKFELFTASNLHTPKRPPRWWVPRSSSVWEPKNLKFIVASKTKKLKYPKSGPKSSKIVFFCENLGLWSTKKRPSKGFWDFHGGVVETSHLEWSIHLHTSAPPSTEKKSLDSPVGTGNSVVFRVFFPSKATRKPTNIIVHLCKIIGFNTNWGRPAIYFLRSFSPQKPLSDPLISWRKSLSTGKYSRASLLRSACFLFFFVFFPSESPWKMVVFIL